MKIDEIRGWSDAELYVKLKDFKMQLLNLRFQHATKQLSNPMLISVLKKDIARVKTVIREKKPISETEASS